MSGLHCVFIKVLKLFISNAIYPAKHVEPTEVKYICMKPAASFIIPVMLWGRGKQKSRQTFESRLGKKKKNYLGLSLVRCLFESWTDDGGFPHIALLWPCASEKRNIPLASPRFIKMGGFPPRVWKPKSETEHLPTKMSSLISVICRFPFICDHFASFKYGEVQLAIIHYGLPY